MGGDNRRPDVLTLRLSSSILQGDEVHEIMLPLEAINAGEGGSQAALEGTIVDGAGQRLQSVSLRTETTGYCQVFSRKNDDNNQAGRFSRSSTSDRTIVIQPTRELKDIGSKARARLEEEKSKRPEVQRLDQVPTIDPEKKKAARLPSAFSAQVASRKTGHNTRKRKLDTTTHTSKHLKSKKPSDTIANEQNWAPDVSHISLPEPKDRSATVKLHGLPFDCTLEHVKKFFTGLQPEFLSILLPNDTSIPQIDASNRPPRSSSEQNRGERHRLRVLAHFRTVSAALLASERSGETIRMNQLEESEKEEDFIIAVTVLPRALEKALTLVVRPYQENSFRARLSTHPISVSAAAALSLSQSIPAQPRTSFAETLKCTLNQLHPMVVKILWTRVAWRLLHNGFPLARDIQQAQLVLGPKEEEALWQPGGSWTTHPGYRRFAEHYNRLVDIQDSLFDQVPYPAVQTTPAGTTFPSSTSKADPVLHLTTEACQALSHEMDVIEGLLYRARITYRFQAK